MKTLVFDTSSIITIAMSGLMDPIRELKKRFAGDFYITPSVKVELVDNPLKTKRFALEAMLISKLIEEGFFKVSKPKDFNKLMKYANSCFYAHEHSIKIVHLGEMESLAMAVEINADAYVVDERTTRLLVENPSKLRELLERKLHTSVRMDKDAVKEFGKMVKGIKIIRSTEMVFVAYEKGYLDNYIPSRYLRKNQVDAILWGMRLKGCAISTEEIEKAKRL